MISTASLSTTSVIQSVATINSELIPRVFTSKMCSEVDA